MANNGQRGILLKKLPLV